MDKKALVVLSGGQDSTTCLYWTIKKYKRENVCAIGFDYGQRHKAELLCAEKICKKENIPFEVIETPIINQLSANSLTREDMKVDKTKPQNSPPNTFVEGRNHLFLSYAAIYAKTHSITDIITGVCETDFSGYPDCRDIFVKSLNVTLNLAMDYKFSIITPLMWKDKKDTWQMADDLGVIDTIYNETLTCYNGIIGEGCGDCPACFLRKRGYDEYLKGKENNNV